ncbi:MAG TPA: serine/threonine-protein kinase, partial [Miltoncostaeaceae bacterium]|nr:serine/threonine-protein kinase [Miltoncostaeaceae bacterium]
PEIAGLSANLADCPACCLRIDRLAADDRLVTQLRHGAASSTDVLVGPAQRRPAVRALRLSHDSKSAIGTPDAAPVIPPAPTAIGEYEILGEVGRGGMGVVYQARHRGLQRPAAVKMVLAGEFASRAQGVRFRLEAELAARVRHPNFVQVYEVGSHDGRPFLALEWVEGGSLADRLLGKPWPPAEAAALVETLARAMHVAHDEGVVHRDLKPANILMAADGTPKITDFGLAQPLEGGRTVTRSGILVGTPGYMAPEQAAGTRALVGPATDVYALGVVLYQLCTGRLPIQADSTLEWLRAVTSDEPVRPRRLQPRLPRDLEAVTLRCLEKEPRHRYPSALALADDLGRFREGKPVLARPAGPVTRLTRACRRRPLVAALLALLALSLLAGMGGVTWKWVEANGQRDLAVAEKQAALYQAYRASLAAAGAAIESHDVADAASHLRSAPEDLRGWEWKHLHSRLDDSSAVFPVPPAEGGVLVAGADRLRVATWTAGGVRLTDLIGGTHSTVPVHPDRGPYTISARQTRLGLRVVSWVGRTSFGLHDETGRLQTRAPAVTPGPDSVYVSPDGTRVAHRWLDGEQARLQIYNAATGELTAVCDGHDTDLIGATFSPDGERIATCGEDLVARVLDAATGMLLFTFRGHTKKVVSVAFSPDGSYLVTASSDGTVRQWDSRTGRERETEPPYERHTSEVFAA